MRIFIIALSILYFLTGFPYSTIAKMYDVEAVGEYVMGDSDTKVEARKIALEHAKLLAIENIGTYLESETIVINGQLSKDEIRTYTAAIIKTTVISEKIGLLENKTTTLKVKIKASVDISMLERKVKEIKSDKKRNEQIKSLQHENLRLLKELESLSSQLKSQKTSEYKSLRKEREIIIEKIDNNHKSMQIVFEKGTLFNLALKSQNEFEEIKKNIDDAFQYMADNSIVTVDEPYIRSSGNMVDLILYVEWKVQDSEEATNKILKFCDKAEEKLWGIRMCSGYFKGGINRTNAFNYFLSKRIVVNLTVGRWKRLCVNEGERHPTSDPWERDCCNFDLRASYTVEIKGIKIEELNDIANIETEVVVE